ncbi:MAG: twin-arginine translocase TatA/TatE family subunit [Collinsella sp.]
MDLTELVIILVFGFLLFGPDKLPQMGRTIGRALRQFRETQEKLTAVVQTEVVDPMAAAAKAPKVAVAAKDEDADVEGSAATEEAPVRKETFAEPPCPPGCGARRQGGRGRCGRRRGRQERPAEDALRTMLPLPSLSPSPSRWLRRLPNPRC